MRGIVVTSMTGMKKYSELTVIESPEKSTSVCRDDDGNIVTIDIFHFSEDMPEAPVKKTRAKKVKTLPSLAIV